MLLEKRFWSKVDKKGPNDCWDWAASLRKGYGEIWDGNKSIYAHRLSWILHNGSIPKGKFVPSQM